MALTAVGQQHVLATLFGPFPSCSASPSGLHIPRGRPTHLRTNSHCATFPPSLMDLNLVITVCFMRGPLFHKYNVSHYFRSQFIARRILQSLPFFWDPLHTSSFVSHLQMVGPFPSSSLLVWGATEVSVRHHFVQKKGRKKMRRVGGTDRQNSSPSSRSALISNLKVLSNRTTFIPAEHLDLVTPQRPLN